MEPGYRELFASWGPPPSLENNEKKADSQGQGVSYDPQLLKKVVAGKLVWNIRTYGHLAADIDPIELETKLTRVCFNQKATNSAKRIWHLPAEIVWEEAPSDIKNGLEAIQRLLQLYTGSIAYEFSHVHDEEERKWLNEQAESGRYLSAMSVEERRGF